MLVCTRCESCSFSPRGEHFLRNSLFNFVANICFIFLHVFLLEEFLFILLSISVTPVFQQYYQFSFILFSLYSLHLSFERQNRMFQVSKF